MTAELPRQIVGFPTATIFAWPIVQMRDVCTLNYGKALKAEARRAGVVPVYGSNGPTGWHDEPLGNGPTVILGRKGQGNLGVEWRDGPFWVIDTAYFVTFSKQLDPRYFYFFADFVGLNHLKDGTSNPSLSRDTFYLQHIPLPPLREQQSIARCLATLDDKIELNRRMNETLEAMAQAIFRDWFVDFGPVRRKLAGATDPVEIMGGVTTDVVRAAELAALFPETLSDDEAPVGWVPHRLDELANLSRATINPLSFPQETFEHYSLPAYDEGQEPVFDAGETIKSNKSLVPVGSVLLSKLNPDIPRVWLPNPPRETRQVASTEFLVFEPQHGIGRALLYFLFKDQTVRQTLESMVTGTSKSHQRVSPPALLQSRLLVASDQCAAAFEGIAEPIIERCLSLRAENRTLAETRDYLLPRLMSGEVRVHEVAKEIAA